MRLTYELGHGSGEYDTDNTRDMPANNLIKALNKLGRLEDIEEELGIDLPKLFKAFNGIWYKSKNGETKFSCHVALTDTLWELRPLEKCLESGNTNDMSETLVLKDYGKTWALTKEELEKGNEDKTR